MQDIAKQQPSSEQNKQVEQPSKLTQNQTQGASSINNEGHSIFKHYEKNLVLFAYNKHKDQITPSEIMLLSRPKKKFKTQQQQEQAVQHLMQGLNFQPKQSQKFILTKVNKQQNNSIRHQITQLISFASRCSREDRMQRRRQIYQNSKARRFSSYPETSIPGRKIRVVNMNSLMEEGTVKNVVSLGGNQFQYEDLMSNQGEKEYYTLNKKIVQENQKYPSISVEQNFLKKIEIEEEDQEETKQKRFEDDDYDSNDEDNPNYDYPEEDYSSRSSEGIIRGSDDDFVEDYEEDSEEMYRKYLKKRRNYRPQMEEQMVFEDYD